MRVENTEYCIDFDDFIARKKRFFVKHFAGLGVFKIDARGYIKYGFAKDDF